MICASGVCSIRACFDVRGRQLYIVVLRSARASLLLVRVGPSEGGAEGSACAIICTWRGEITGRPQSRKSTVECR